MVITKREDVTKQVSVKYSEKKLRLRGILSLAIISPNESGTVFYEDKSGHIYFWRECIACNLRLKHL